MSERVVTSWPCSMHGCSEEGTMRLYEEQVRDHQWSGLFCATHGAWQERRGLARRPDGPFGPQDSQLRLDERPRSLSPIIKESGL